MQTAIIKTVTKNTFWLLLGNLGNRLLSFLLIIVLARRLGAVGFGKFSFAQSFPQLFVVLMDLGMGFLIIREVARHKEQASKCVGNVLALRIILSFFVFGLSALVIKLLNYPWEAQVLVYLFSAYFILVSWGALFSSIFMAYEKMEFNVLISLFERVFIILLCLLALQRELGLLTVGGIYCLGGVLSFLLSWGFLRFKFGIKPRLETDWRFIMPFLKESLPIAIGSALVIFYVYSNIVILSKLKGDQAVGWYSCGFYLAYYIQLIPSAFLGAIFPLMSRLFNDSQDMLKRVYQKAFSFMLAVTIPISLGGYLLADKIILYFYKPSFSNAILVFQILILGTVFFCVYGFFGHFLVSINRQVVATKITALAVAINLIIAFITIGRLGHLGAAIAIFISGLVSFSVCLVYLIKIDYSPIWFKPMLKVLIASFFMIIVLVLGKAINLFLLIFFGFVVYACCLYLVRYFTAEDWRLIRAFREARK
ncbi:MAG: flippase [Candidatus Omnitrophota bacterium]|nr:flippase [Candidatus Omnitrophota bacterium]